VVPRPSQPQAPAGFLLGELGRDLMRESRGAVAWPIESADRRKGGGLGEHARLRQLETVPTVAWEGRQAPDVFLGQGRPL
jgi:hypothetical protein